MQIPQLSIVIPTHKRPDILAECLRRIEKQTIAKHLEVIVVSDGHDKRTAALAERLMEAEGGPTPPLASFRFLEIPKSHQGTARNRGIALAKAPLCLLIGDDIYLEPDACERHLTCHGSAEPVLSKAEGLTMTTLSPRAEPRGDKDGIAVLGFTTWDTDMEINGVMRWLETSGWQFGYPLLARYAGKTVPPDIQHRFTYTSNLSIPTALAKAHPFREDVSLYGWEDIEWGQRLRQAGVPLLYEPAAKALHHHHLTLRESLRRMETIGASSVHLRRIAPSLDRTPTGWKLAAYYAIAFLPTLRGRHTRAFLRGMRAA